MSYTGIVTHYRTGAPLAGIPVSDGRNTVKTDADGRFELEGWERAHVIHVGILTDRHNDWFLPIEQGKEEYRFSVTPVEIPSDFCFLHISDTEIENKPYADRVACLREAVIRNRPAFFINTGDLCIKDGLERHYLLMNRETMGCPVRYAIGNHDFTAEGAYGEALYEKFYGPTWYSFDCGDIHFAVLSIGKGDKPSGYQMDDQWKWLLEDLELVDPSKR